MNILSLDLQRVKRVFMDQERAQDSIHLVLMSDQGKALMLQEELNETITGFIDALKFDENLKEALHQYYICCFLGGSELKLMINSKECTITNIDSLFQCLNSYLQKL